MNKKFFIIFISLLLICLNREETFSWGFFGHKRINKMAILTLPEGMIGFYKKHMDYITEHAVDPDKRRYAVAAEGARHYIDIDHYGKQAFEIVPKRWNEAVKKFTEDTLQAYGIVPWHIEKMVNRLTEAFKKENLDMILHYSADLGHYIADAHVPLHTTINYDGQLTDQKGLHSLWESMIPELEISTYNLFTKHKAKYLNKPEETIWKAIRKANVLLPDMLAKEKEVTKQFTKTEKFRVQMRRGKEVKSYTTAFAKAYAASLKNSINVQLLSSAEMIADFWYTSWVDAGKPDLSGLFKSNESASIKLINEKNAYSDNTLIQKGLLLSTLNKSASE